MATVRARPGEVIDIRPLGNRLATSQTTTLIKTKALEVIRMVLPAGHKTSQHHVPGEITVQCLEGRIQFEVEETTHEMTAGQLLYLNGGQRHHVQAVDDSSVLLTILLQKHAPDDHCSDEYAQKQPGFRGIPWEGENN